MLNVHIGCGFNIGKSWINYDKSLTARVEKIPFVKKILRINKKSFPKEVIYGDIVRKPLSNENQCKNIFCAYTLEHLEYEECQIALKNIYYMLSYGGCFRVIVPSLESRINKYNKKKDAHEFLMSLGIKKQFPINSGFINYIRDTFGSHRHLWMYDENSLKKELIKAGFINIKKCHFNDAEDKVFNEIEREDEFIDRMGNIEVALECSK
tara:strand:- start:121 stop:747 length:627 start_codon:yes stop_codon:yes gene_type:complete